MFVMSKQVGINKNIEKGLRELISELRVNPSSYPSLRELRDIISKVGRSILMSLQSESKNGSLEAHSIFGRFYYDVGIASAYLYLTHDLKLDEKMTLEIISRATEVLMGFKSLWDLKRQNRALVEKLVEIIKESGTVYLLEYASELGVIYYDGERWHVTPLSEFLLKLPPLEMSKALLTLEVVLSRGNIYCMTRDFLERLIFLFSRSKTHRIDFIADMTGYSRELATCWLERLNSLGIVAFKDEYCRVEITGFGEIAMSEVLSAENRYMELFKFIMKEGFSSLSLGVGIKEFEKLKDDSLLFSRRKELEQAIKSLAQGDYVVAYRTVIPVIEYLLREIAVKEGIAGTNLGMKSLASKLYGAKLLSEGTEALVRALGRDTDVHGLEPLEQENASFYAFLAFVTLREILKDYRRHTFLRKVLMIVAKEVGMKPKELLKAYPNDRNTIHVQFISDNIIRVTIHGSHVYEAKKINGKIKLKRVGLKTLTQNI
jgi:hypothetical protein